MFRNNAALEKQLGTLKKSELIRVLTSIYGLDAHIDNLIDRHIYKAINPGSRQSNDALIAQIDSLRDDAHFISYGASSAFAAQLESLLGEAEELGSSDPDAALTVIQLFLSLPNALFQRVDDSDGNLGDVFKFAMQLWLKFAEQVRAGDADGAPWLSKILSYVHNDGYGVFDDLISASGGLLTPQELRQLASTFEQELARRLRDGSSSDDSYAGIKAALGLRAVAVALADIQMYEASVLLRSPEPNTLQVEDIVRFALSIDALERVEYWLGRPLWKADPGKHRSLRNQWLQKTGQAVQLENEMRELFRSHPTLWNLEECLHYMNGPAVLELRQAVEALPEPPDKLYQRVQMLILLESIDEAARLLVRHAAQLENVYFGALTAWIELFSRNDNLLAEVVCYRALLDDLLNRGYTRAYRHGARYFKQLLALDKAIADYEGLVDAQTYIRKLQTAHGRKHSFWKAADHPAK
ncbi:DUF6880 family protein [Allohahella marinimesophila]|uniref:Uncharacterized protein n=1 Tax=Allohahella marinimesophila TaxID=1054972 RepID=A0ABP7Q3V6_9GAMM